MPRPSRLQTLIHSLEQPGVAMRRRDLIRHYGRSAFDQARVRRLILPILLDVYAHRSHAGHVKTRITAANVGLAGKGYLSGVAACVVHGISIKRQYRVTFIVEYQHRIRAASWLRIRHFTWTAPTVQRRDHSVASLPYALVQVCWDEGMRIGRGLILDAIRIKGIDAAAILDALNTYPKFPHRKALTAFLITLRGGIDSYLEYLADITVLNTPSLRRLARQVELTAAGKRYRVDAYDVTTRTAVEFDGAAFHNDDVVRRRDLARDADLASIGVLTLRLTYEDVTQRPHWCRTIILNTIESRQTATTAS